jgi:hypothetical protein
MEKPEIRSTKHETKSKFENPMIETKEVVLGALF